MSQIPNNKKTNIKLKDDIYIRLEFDICLLLFLLRSRLEFVFCYLEFNNRTITSPPNPTPTPTTDIAPNELLV